ncbi:MAG: helix-turn-helix transcriptional regulator [Bacteriovorax sp.]|nr:helix-turn-helix transcriptional regulator [Bacteriovorax sp.]
MYKEPQETEAVEAKIKIPLEGEILFAINKLISTFIDKKKGLRILSKQMGVSEKTLTRIINQTSKPNYQTIFKIYRVYFNEYNDAKVLKLVPTIVKDFLLKRNPQELLTNQNYNLDSDILLQSNSVIAEIYIIASTGPVTLDEILYRFGVNGVELVSKMIEKKLLSEIHKNVFILGKNQPTFDGNTIVSVGQSLISSHAKPSSGESLGNNFISFYAEGLSESAYNEWLAIDRKAFEQKYELTRNSKNLGSIRAFTFMISETIQTKELH